MRTLLCFGLGYCARHYVDACGSRFARVVGTVRDTQKAVELEKRIGRRAAEVLALDEPRSMGAILGAIVEADAVLVSAPPGEAGDPVLRVFAEPLSTAPRLASIVYLSTIGVYGDHGGHWVDETTGPRPQAGRARARLGAEAAWQAVGHHAGAAVAVLRLAGIYGPERNALVSAIRGTARRIVKPGQVFNRIHVADIAQAIDAAFAQRASGLFNVTDDEPGPPQDVIAFAAELLRLAPPPELSFAEAEATMAPMARSFYGDNKRVCNRRLKTELGVSLRYPTYRHGLSALLAAHVDIQEAISAE